MKPYTPEWKLYFWKRILLNPTGGVIKFLPDNFVDKMIRSHNGIPALVELAAENPASLEIENIELKINVLAEYRKKRREYLAMEEKKRLAGMISGGVHVSTADKRYTDPFCGLSEPIFKKVENGEKLTFQELVHLTRNTTNPMIYPWLLFNMRISKENLSKHLGSYTDDFMNGKLVAEVGVRYFKFDQQKNDILSAIKSLSTKYGDTNMPVTLDELAQHGGWAASKNGYRFYETLLALEKLGEITINDLRENEAVISLPKEPEKESEPAAEESPLIVNDNGKKFPHKLPYGTKWENFVIEFLNDDEVIVRVMGNEYHLDYKAMGFEDKRKTTNKEPNSQWALLRLLARHQGELSWENSEANISFKKCKERLTAQLNSYFPIEYDPFYPYKDRYAHKKAFSYKIKMTLIPPPRDEELPTADSLTDEINDMFGELTE